MTKAELIAAMAAETGESKTKVEAFYAAQALVMRKALKEGDDFPMPAVGKFSAAKRDAREARNPSNGETIQVPAKTVVKFKVAHDLAVAVNYRAA